jgi:restriction system protein
MAVPSFQEMFLPFLQLLADGQGHRLPELAAHIANHFHLTAEDKSELIPSGQSSKLSNRVGWARTHLKNAGLIEPVQSGVYRITQAGRDVVTNPPPKLNLKFLDTIPQHYDWFHRRKVVTPTAPARLESDETPEEKLAGLVEDMRQNLAAELKQTLADIDPFRFERVVLDLLRAMGYGGSRAESGWVTKRTGDEGIDGIINEDRLGLSQVHIQAKRWKGSVGRKEIQSFVGALAGQQANKGVFITTGEFTAEARAYAKNLAQKIILIDGHRLAELMIDHGVGVTEERAYTLKKIDSDYFVES